MPRVPMRLWSATRWIIAINIGVFIADLLSFGALYNWGRFSIDKAIYHLQIWRFLTSEFIHASPSHILFNMIVLYFYGPLLEPALGRRLFVLFYLVSGLSGDILYLVLWRMHFLHVSADSQLIGASGCIMGVIAGATTLAPNMTMRLWFPPVAPRLITLLWIFIGIAFCTIWTAGHNAGGEAAHLGGAAAGFLMITNLRWLKQVSAGKTNRRRFWKPGDPQSSFFREEFRQ
jgi:membrane associated rhomboid family serine protease